VQNPPGTEMMLDEKKVIIDDVPAVINDKIMVKLKGQTNPVRIDELKPCTSMESPPS
jgi:hypothetical protein